MEEDARRVGHLVEGGAYEDEVGEDLVGVVKVVAEEVRVDLGEVGARGVAVEEA